MPIIDPIVDISISTTSIDALVSKDRVPLNLGYLETVWENVAFIDDVEYDLAQYVAISGLAVY